MKVNWIFLDKYLKDHNIKPEDVGPKLNHKAGWYMNSKQKDAEWRSESLIPLAYALNLRVEDFTYTQAEKPTINNQDKSYANNFSDLTDSVKLLGKQLNSIDNRLLSMAKGIGELMDFAEQDHDDIGLEKQLFERALQINGEISDKDMAVINRLLNVNPERLRAIKSELRLASIVRKEGPNNKDVRYWKIETGIGI